MKKFSYPAKMWYYCAELQANIRYHTAHDIPTLNGQVPETVVTGNMAGISDLVEFGWYQWVYWRDSMDLSLYLKNNLEKILIPQRILVLI